jgi:hypothetical protein
VEDDDNDEMENFEVEVGESDDDKIDNFEIDIEDDDEIVSQPVETPAALEEAVESSAPTEGVEPKSVETVARSSLQDDEADIEINPDQDLEKEKITYTRESLTATKRYSVA